MSENQPTDKEILENYKYAVAHECTQILRDLEKGNYGVAKDRLIRLRSKYGEHDRVGYRG